MRLMRAGRYKQEKILSVPAKSLFIAALVFIVTGCGYTTSGSKYTGSKIIVSPITNKIDITSEQRKYSGYVSYPVLIEKRLTNEVVSRFNSDGHIQVVNSAPMALSLTCVVNDYKKEALRYTESDDIKEQRLRLYVSIELKSYEGETLKAKNVVGESSFFLSGARRKSETAAQAELIDDTARRIVEAIIEEW